MWAHWGKRLVTHRKVPTSILDITLLSIYIYHVGTQKHPFQGHCWYICTKWNICIFVAFLLPLKILLLTSYSAPIKQQYTQSCNSSYKKNEECNDVLWLVDPWPRWKKFCNMLGTNSHMHILAAIKSYWNIYAYAYTYAYGYTQTHTHAHTIYIYTLFSNILCIAKTLQYTWIKQSFAKLNFVYSLTVELIQKLDGYQGSLRISCWSPIRKTKEALTLSLLHNNFNATEIQDNTKQWKKCRVRNTKKNKIYGWEKIF